MLTVRFDLLSDLGLHPGALVLDAGAGFGRHAFELARRGYRTVALDRAADEVTATQATLAAMTEGGEVEDKHVVGVVRGDATALPFPDGCFDAVITSEVLEHIPDDVGAITELRRVLRRGGLLAVTVPSWLPETINWMLSDDYHAPAAVGGHVRIYTATELKAKLRTAGIDTDASHHAHALHSPYWWLRCAVGVDDEDHPLVRRYRRFLEWDIIRRPRSTRIADRILSPLLGKSLVLYGVAR
jgi:SAM-dependent methyltransferase